MGTNLIPVNEIQTMAIAVAKSGLFGMKTPEQAMALMLVAQSENLHPARAAMEYHIINGKPALKADAMLSRFQNAGGKVEWKKYTDDECVGLFSHPSGGSVEITWTLAMAAKAGLTSNPTWKKFSRAMLRSRCISEGIRTIYPGVSVGIYTPEEVQDFEPHQEKDITPAQTPEKKAENLSKAKAAIKPAIEGESKPVRGTITGNPEEGDLSGLGVDKPDTPTLDKIVGAYGKIGIDIPMLESILGKQILEWNMKDVAELRELYTEKKAEYESSKEEI